MSKHKKVAQVTAEIDAFLRSINIVLDAEHPDRVAHFRPTGKSLKYLRVLLESSDQHTWLIAAPYGSGKSLATACGMHFIENQPSARQAMRSVVDRVASVDPKFAKRLQSRMRSKKHGLVLALHGHAELLPEAIQAAAADAVMRLGYGKIAGGVRRRRCSSIEDAVAILDSLIQEQALGGIDQLVIVWDEFGRHLEALAGEGRSSELLDVQFLAEWASRVTSCRVCLSVLLHQGMLNYASGLPDVARREWAKIEGRFERLE